MSNFEHSFSLIEGSFEVEEAREVLMSLISRKIEFHHKKNLRHQETNGFPHEGSLNRVNELKKIRTEILSHLKKLKKQQAIVSIKSDVFFSVEECFFPDNQEK